MFKRRDNGHLPKHIEYYTYKRDKAQKEMPDTDRDAIEEFYKKNNITLERIKIYQQSFLFKRTVNYIYLVAHFFDKKDKGNIGVVRTLAYVFHKSGTLLYELDHDNQSYKGVHTTQTNAKKLLKLNYGMHDELNNPYLQAIGRHCENFIKFDSACHDLLKQDKVCKSVDFIMED